MSIFFDHLIIYNYIIYYPLFWWRKMNKIKKIDIDENVKKTTFSGSHELSCKNMTASNKTLFF